MAIITPVMTIDQATLSAGVSGESRSDGVVSQQVTVTLAATSAYAASSDTGRYSVRIISVEPIGATVPTVSAVSNRVFVFTPAATDYGRTYRIEATVDGGTATEATVIRTFSIRTRNHTLRVPAPGERASPDVTLQDMGSDKVAVSETNEGASPWGHQQAYSEMFSAIDSLLGWTVFNTAISSASLVVQGVIGLDPGFYTFDCITEKASTGATLAVDIYGLTETAIMAAASHTAAVSTAARTTASATFEVTARGLYQIRASVSTSTGTLRAIQIRRAVS